MTRQRNVLIIDGHPDVSPQRFLHALAASYARGARAGGHAVRVINVGMVEGMSDKQRGGWLQKLEKLGSEPR